MDIVKKVKTNATVHMIAEHVQVLQDFALNMPVIQTKHAQQFLSEIAVETTYANLEKHMKDALRIA